MAARPDAFMGFGDILWVMEMVGPLVVLYRKLGIGDVFWTNGVCI